MAGLFECKLCGRVFNAGVMERMEHLEMEHNAEFVDRVLTLFYDPID